ncbi:MAG: DnaJ domain-containing protein [Candidatus Limnocylindria bacterium]
MSAPRDHYKTLQVAPEADPEVIGAAYQVLAGRLHPETDASGIHEYRKAELDRAYAVLVDPARRQAYDAERRIELTAVGPGPEPETDEVTAQHDGADHGHANGTRLDFGRYTGWTLAEIAAEDADYLRWLSRHSSGLRFRGEINRLLHDVAETAYSPRAAR